jgi:hypothetical protein
MPIPRIAKWIYLDQRSIISQGRVHLNLSPTQKTKESGQFVVLSIVDKVAGGNNKINTSSRSRGRAKVINRLSHRKESRAYEQLLRTMARYEESQLRGLGEAINKLKTSRRFDIGQLHVSEVHKSKNTRAIAQDRGRLPITHQRTMCAGLSKIGANEEWLRTTTV